MDGMGACGGSLMRASLRKLTTEETQAQKNTRFVTKAEMTLVSHKTSEPGFSSKQTRKLTWCCFGYTCCQNSV